MPRAWTPSSHPLLPTWVAPQGSRSGFGGRRLAKRGSGAAHGNLVLRQLGIPTVTGADGILRNIDVPIGNDIRGPQRGGCIHSPR